MTTITAALVKELRDRTNAGMMECKGALQEAGGDIEKAIDIMRKSGQAKAVKKAGRTTAEGTIVVVATEDGKRAAIIEINSETDFVAREEKFKAFARNVGQQVLENQISSTENLPKAIDQARLDLVAQFGENITIRRLVFKGAQTGVVGAYTHGDANGVRIGALVVLKSGSKDLARDLAMQVAAMNPEYLQIDDIPEARLNKEKEIFIEQTREEGKPEAMLEKIVAGKLKRFATEVTLLGQAYVKDQNKTIEALLKENNAVVDSFIRYEVGEGMEKKEDNFVEEVMAQVRGS